MTSCSLLHIICDICMAAGGLGTVGTLIYMICDSKRKTKQIETVQQIQSHQLESLYEPDIRIISYNGIKNNLVIHNHGENLIILDIHELSDSGILNTEGMERWFPHHFDKGNKIHIPLSFPMSILQREEEIIIECRNRLGLEYVSNIQIVKGKPSIKRPIIK